jgi:hypothetical protein
LRFQGIEISRNWDFKELRFQGIEISRKIESNFFFKHDTVTHFGHCQSSGRQTDITKNLNNSWVVTQIRSFAQMKKLIFKQLSSQKKENFTSHLTYKFWLLSSSQFLIFRYPLHLASCIRVFQDRTLLSSTPFIYQCNLPSSSAVIPMSICKCLFSHSFTTYEWLNRHCEYVQNDIGVKSRWTTNDTPWLL